jgi:phosphoribosyl-dephospho-CoA transferase
LTTEIKEMRWEYISLKTQLMGNSKQSAIARKVQPYGLEELTQAPQKIYVEE